MQRRPEASVHLDTGASKGWVLLVQGVQDGARYTLLGRRALLANQATARSASDAKTIATHKWVIGLSPNLLANEAPQVQMPSAQVPPAELSLSQAPSLQMQSVQPLPAPAGTGIRL